MLGWMVDKKGIEPHVPVWEKGERNDGTFSRSEFIFDPVSVTPARAAKYSSVIDARSNKADE